MTTIKYKAAFRCLMDAVGVRNPGTLALMHDDKRLYTVLRLCGYKWSAKAKHWTFSDR